MILIDVRTKKEYETKHIDGSIHHNVTDMIKGLLPDVEKDKAITVYCQSGGRSKIAKIILEKAGFQKITDGGSIDNFIQQH